MPNPVGQKYSSTEKAEKLSEARELLRTGTATNIKEAASAVDVAEVTLQRWLKEDEAATGEPIPAPNGHDRLHIKDQPRTAEEVHAENKELRAENARLRKLLIDALIGSVKLSRVRGVD